jgi:hypothetical protein
MTNTDDAVVAPRSADEYADEISAIWNGADMEFHSTALRTMYDLIIDASKFPEARERICRDMRWTSSEFDRFLTIGRLYRKSTHNQRDLDGLRSLVEQKPERPEGLTFEENKLREIEAQLRHLICGHIGAAIRTNGHFGIRTGTSAEPLFNLGVGLSKVEKVGKNHYSLTFKMDDQLSDEGLGLTLADRKEIDISIEQWASGYTRCEINSADFEKYLTHARITETTRCRMLADLGAEDLNALAARIGPVITAIALASASAV